MHDVLWGEWTEEEEDEEERERVACDAAASVTRTLAARRRGLCVAALACCVGAGKEGTEGKGVSTRADQEQNGCQRGISVSSMLGQLLALADAQTALSAGTHRLQVCGVGKGTIAECRIAKP